MTATIHPVTIPAMLTLWLTFLTALLGAEPAPATPAADPQVTHWLDKLEARGAQIRTLSASVVYDKNNPLLGEQQKRIGSLVYRAADTAAKKSAAFAVDFDKLILDDQLRPQQLQFIFDGDWLVEKDHARKMFQKRQIVAPGQVYDPLQLDGPFPLPIGQKRAEVLARFTVTLIPPAEGDPANSVHLQLAPRPDAPRAEGAKQFKLIDLYLDQASVIPVKVSTLDEQTLLTIVSLAGIRENPAVDAKFDTTPPPPNTGWHVEITDWKK